MFYLPFWKVVYSERKEFAPFGSKFFSFRVDPICEGAWCAVEQTESHKRCLSCKQEKCLTALWTIFQKVTKSKPWDHTQSLMPAQPDRAILNDRFLKNLFKNVKNLQTQTLVRQIWAFIFHICTKHKARSRAFSKDNFDIFVSKQILCVLTGTALMR